MANRVRGEVEITVGGCPFVVSMALGTLAEIETAFGCDGFETALERVFGSSMSARSMLTFVEAVLKGSGHTIDDDTRKALRLMTPAEFGALALQIMSASGLVERKGEAEAGSSAGPLVPRTDGATG